MSNLKSTLSGALTAALALSLAVSGPADARRGGSFGSRGYRTYSAPRPTQTTPGYTAPVQRSMTPQQPGGSQYGYRPTGPSYMPGYQQNAFNRPRMGFGTGLMAGLLTGGLIGGMMGHGWGMGWGGIGGGWGMGGGFLTILIQLLIFGFIASLVMRMFRRRSAYAGGFDEPMGFAGPQPGPWGGAVPPSPDAGPPSGGPWSAADEIAVTSADRAAFEKMLADVQDAFAREDYGRLRELCTPEVMGYLAEELSDNATHGRKNDVSQVRLLQSDISEAWREGDADYATVALRYESIDVMRDRTTGAVLSGDATRPTATTEVWTFVRRAGSPWKLSAIQET